MGQFLDAWVEAHNVRDIAAEIGEIAYAGFWLRSHGSDGAAQHQGDEARKKIAHLEAAVAKLKAALEPALSPQSEDLKS